MSEKPFYINITRRMMEKIGDGVWASTEEPNRSASELHETKEAAIKDAAWYVGDAETRGHHEYLYTIHSSELGILGQISLYDEAYAVAYEDIETYRQENPLVREVDDE